MSRVSPVYMRSCLKPIKSKNVAKVAEIVIISEIKENDGLHSPLIFPLPRIISVNGEFYGLLAKWVDFNFSPRVFLVNYTKDVLERFLCRLLTTVAKTESWRFFSSIFFRPFFLKTSLRFQYGSELYQETWLYFLLRSWRGQECTNLPSHTLN